MVPARPLELAAVATELTHRLTSRMAKRCIFINFVWSMVTFCYSNKDHLSAADSRHNWGGREKQYGTIRNASEQPGTGYGRGRLDQGRAAERINLARSSFCFFRSCLLRYIMCPAV